jgi:hypothetical protein
MVKDQWMSFLLEILDELGCDVCWLGIGDEIPMLVAMSEGN